MYALQNDLTEENVSWRNVRLHCVRPEPGGKLVNVCKTLGNNCILVAYKKKQLKLVNFAINCEIGVRDGQYVCQYFSKSSSVQSVCRA